MQEALTDDIPETVLITGSLIRGTAAVGVPVTQLRTFDFIQTGSLTTADLFRSFPAANVQPGPLSSSSGGRIERAIRVIIRGLDTGSAARNLMMVDGFRVPAMSNGLCTLDPSIIPSLAVDRIDILVDGAKIAGILPEAASAASGQLKHVLLGVGINVNNSFQDAEVEYPFAAISMLEHAGGGPDEAFDRSALLIDCLAQIDEMLARLSSGDSANGSHC